MTYILALDIYTYLNNSQKSESVSVNHNLSMDFIRNNSATMVVFTL